MSDRDRHSRRPADHGRDHGVEGDPLVPGRHPGRDQGDHDREGDQPRRPPDQPDRAREDRERREEAGDRVGGRPAVGVAALVGAHGVTLARAWRTRSGLLPSPPPRGRGPRPPPVEPSAPPVAVGRPRQHRREPARAFERRRLGPDRPPDDPAEIDDRDLQDHEHEHQLPDHPESVTGGGHRKRGIHLPIRRSLWTSVPASTKIARPVSLPLAPFSQRATFIRGWTRTLLAAPPDPASAAASGRRAPIASPSRACRCTSTPRRPGLPRRPRRRPRSGGCVGCS